MTQDRRITDKLPGQPLQWDEPVPGGLTQEFREKFAGIFTPAATPAAGQAGLATDWQKEVDGIADELESEALCYEGDFADTVNGCVEALREVVERAAPVAAATEQATDGQQDKSGNMPPFAAPAGIVGGPGAAEDQDFYRFWYGHMQGDTMTGSLADVRHSTARYIWDAALATPADAGAGLTEELAQQVLNALTLAMTICDAVPTRLHKSEDSQLANIGMLVNAQDNGEHGYAVIRDAKAAFEQAATIPKGAARSWNGTTYYNIEEMYHHFEDGEALHMWLDDKGVPRADAEGKVFSLVGRVARLSTPSAPVTASEPVFQVQQLGFPSAWCDVSQYEFFCCTSLKRVVYRAPVGSPAPVTASDYVLLPREITVEMAVAAWGRDVLEQAPGATYVDDETKGIYARLISAAPAPVTASDLHSAILSIPSEVERTVFANWSRTEQTAYTAGHRDARLEAAKMVVEFSPAPVTAEPAAWMSAEQKPEPYAVVMCRLSNGFQRVGRWSGSQWQYAEFLHHDTERNKYPPIEQKTLPVVEWCALLATPAPADRDAILEEAAKACDDYARAAMPTYRNDANGALCCARNIRALKSMERAADAKGDAA